MESQDLTLGDVAMGGRGRVGSNAPGHAGAELDQGLSGEEFEWLCEVVRTTSGLSLHAGKQALVRARLGKRARQLGLSSVSEYIALVRQDLSGPELGTVLDALLTNQTRFFRESQHFQDLLELVVPTAKERRLRVWSAGCSSGEEPYSIAMTLLDGVPDLSLWDARVLGTDLSRRCITRAKAGRYEESRIDSVPLSLRERHFSRVRGAMPPIFAVNARVRALVDLVRLNLVEPWPMRGPFDAIYCRNVMIYFDRATQLRLVERFHELLRPRGVLFIGPAESLTSRARSFRYVRPTVYLKP